jgi:hypothetical protein
MYKPVYYPELNKREKRDREMKGVPRKSILDVGYWVELLGK